MSEVLFWASLGILVYGYVGFPLLVAAVGFVRRRDVDRGDIQPSVTVIVAAYNEEDDIRERIENVLASDYPPDALEVIVASDGSTDRTNEIAAEYEDRGVRLLALPRRGKLHALDAAVARAQGEILVFTDANTSFASDAIRRVVGSFADSDVGGVVGDARYSHGAEEESVGRGEALYWKYDRWLKRMESLTGSVVSAHGGFYAIRKSLYRRPEDPAVTDDFGISTAIVAQGRRLVYDPSAHAYEQVVGEAVPQFWRRVRMMTRGFRGVLLRRELLNPFRYGFYSVVLFSHKVVRRLLSLVLPVLLVSSIALAVRGPSSLFYSAAVAGQVAFFALAGAGFFLRGSPLGHRRLLYIPFFYCMANGAAVLAFLNALRGRRIQRWNPERRMSGA